MDETQGDNTKEKTEDEIESEFPAFLNQLKWTIINDKIVNEGGIQVQPEEIKNFARQQLFSYMGASNFTDEQPWMNDYTEKMMKDRKFVEDAYTRIQTQKVFEWAESQITPEEKDISAEDFKKMVESHHHHH